MPARLARFILGPRQTLLYLPKLSDPFFGDRERLDKHRDVPEAARHGIQVDVVLDYVFRHEAVASIYAALGEASCEAEILASAAARRTGGLRTRSPNRRYREISGL